MNIILLSGGSGKRLWPLSNDARSKQFLRLLQSPDGSPESMIQRVVRQIRLSGLTDHVTVATGANQRDAIENQLGSTAGVVTEPCRRDTFPAIVLATSYLAAQGVDDNETVIVMPCDSYTQDSYFHTLGAMDRAVQANAASMVLMGIRPTYPSAKYGYIVPAAATALGQAAPVQRFVEKPQVPVAEELIANGAMWNGGVFAFRLGFMRRIATETVGTFDYETLYNTYAELPKISFDYAVVEKTPSIAVVPYAGEWRDLGTWNTLTDVLQHRFHGNVVTDNCTDSYAVNELGIPMVCIGTRGIIAAASPDGIIIADRSQSENIKHLVDNIGTRPMYEERRWGEYRVIDNVTFDDGFSALTKQLVLQPGCAISYQSHDFRHEVWTFVDGEGLIVLDGELRPVKRGDVITIPAGQKHALKAITPLTFIEVQQGTNLVETDIHRYSYTWPE